MSNLHFIAEIVINPPVPLTQGPATLNELFDNIFKFLQYIIGVIAVIMIIYAGFMYVTSVGNPQKTKLALNTIIYTCVGFGIAILGRAIINVIYPKVAGQTNLAAVLTDGINTFLYVIGIASVIVMIISGILYAVSTGDPGKTRVAKDSIVYALIGLVVAIMAGAVIGGLNTYLNTGHL